MTSPLFTIVVDTREQAPWSFPADVAVQPGALLAGDYSLAGLETQVVIERKELGDLVGCVTHDRERFTAELVRLRGYPAAAVLVEADLRLVAEHQYRSRTCPEAVLGSLAAWTWRYGVPIIFAGDRVLAARYALALLRNFHRGLIEQARTLGMVPSQAAPAVTTQEAPPDA